MKFWSRLTMLAAALSLCVTMLAGCGSTEKPSQPDDPDVQNSAVAISADKIYSQIEALGVLPEMLILDDAYISGYYGIAEDAIAEKVFAVADDSLKADTVIIVKAVDDGKAAEMAGTFSAVNNQRLVELESYNPEQFARVENAVIKNNGCYVYYIVSDDNNAVVQLIEKNIG